MGVYGQADGSAYLEQGNSKVSLITIDPAFMKYPVF
jgi:ribonuclease PH